MLISGQKTHLQIVGKDPDNANPKLDEVKRLILQGAQKNPDLRCIVFVKTREMTEAIANWMNQDRQLKPLGTKPLAGKGQSADKAGA